MYNMCSLNCFLKRCWVADVSTHAYFKFLTGPRHAHPYLVRSDSSCVPSIVGLVVRRRKGGRGEIDLRQYQPQPILENTSNWLDLSAAFAAVGREQGVLGATALAAGIPYIVRAAPLGAAGALVGAVIPVTAPLAQVETTTTSTEGSSRSQSLVARTTKFQA